MIVLSFIKQLTQSNQRFNLLYLSAHGVLPIHRILWTVLFELTDWQVVNYYSDSSYLE